MNWSVYSYSLLLKSYVEYENYRTKERAILQLQVLVDQLSNETTPLLSNKKENENSAPVWERLMVTAGERIERSTFTRSGTLHSGR